MATVPTLTTGRLSLRAFTLEDAPEVERYVADREIARTTLMIPHPYPPGAAAEWIATHEESFENGTGYAFAITLRDDGQLVGAIDIRVSAEHRCGEIGYVIYRPWWGRGIATEAVASIIRYGFEQLDLNRIEAHHFDNNPASGRLLKKNGMTFEGTLRQKITKWGEFRDCPQFSILRSEYSHESGDDGHPVEKSPADSPVPRPIVLPQIETTRLILRELTPEDATALSRICNHEQFARALDGVELPYTPERARRFIDEAAALVRDGCAAPFAMVLRENGNLIGDIVIWKIRRAHRRASLGIALDRQHWGQGLATEALKALIEFAFITLNLNRLDAQCFTWNEASARVLDRCGFRREGLRRQSDFCNGEWFDDMLYGLLRED